MNNATIIEKIGIIRDRIRRKKIVFFLMKYQENSHTNIRDEASMWVDLDKSPTKMKHESERKLIEKHLL